MIINQIDEEAPDSSKTIDTRTGLYLVPSGAHIGDRTYTFAIRDGDTSIDVITEKNGSLDEDKKLYRLFYRIESVNIHGEPKRRGYVRLIKKLLRVHGDLFRSSERRFGIVQHVKVEMEPAVIAHIGSWERNIRGILGWLPF